MTGCPGSSGAPSSPAAISTQKIKRGPAKGQAGRHTSPRPAQRTSHPPQCSRSFSLPWGFLRGEEGERRNYAGGKGLVGTLNFEATEKFNSEKLLFLTRKYRITLSGESGLWRGNGARLSWRLFPLRGKGKVQKSGGMVT